MYHYAHNGQQQGPVDEAELRSMIESGTLSPNDLCWRPGMSQWERIGEVFSVPPALDRGLAGNQSLVQSIGPTAPSYLYISPARLVVMSVLSLHLYESYWIYKNWRYFKERDNLNIRPFWRGWFGIFFCHSLLKQIRQDPQTNAVSPSMFSAGSLATGWIVLLLVSNAMSRAPGLAPSILGVLVPSFLCLLPVQKYINGVIQRTNPRQSYHPWSAGHIVCLIFGVVIWGLLLFGLGAEAVNQGQ